MMKECERCGAALDPGETCDCSSGEELALRVIQVPVIFENLGDVKYNLDRMLDSIRELPRNEESLRRIRAMRAAATKQFAALEDQRKSVKRQVMEPYNAAMEAYREYISAPYSKADQELKDWIDSYQQELKDSAQERLREYFQELCRAQNIDFLKFEDCGIELGMAEARQKTLKRSMDCIRNFVLAVRAEVNVILTMEDAPQIMAEYHSCLNLAKAVCLVQDRKRAACAMGDFVAMQRSCQARQEAHRAELASEAPELLQEDPQYSVAFLATGSLTALKAMKAQAAALGVRLDEIQQEDTENEQ